jgi:hypothetical protein
MVPETEIDNDSSGDSTYSLLDDGYGNTHSRVCPSCDRQTMFIHSKGDFRCRLCYVEVYVAVSF